MNKELLRQFQLEAGGSHYPSINPEIQERFALLIVRECVRACFNEGKTYEIESAGEYSSNLYATAIKKHFGVEE